MSQYTYGRNSVLASLKAENVEKIYLQEGFDFSPILQEISRQKLDIFYVSKKKLEVMVGEKHQGVVAEVKDFDYADLEQVIKQNESKKDAVILILDELNDPHNFGAIIRSADAFNIAGIIIKKDRQVRVTPTVTKVATGAENYVPIMMVTNLAQAIDKLKANGYWVVGADGNSDKTIQDSKYDFKVALIIGSEGYGISRLILSKCDFIYKIPMLGHVNSLNASVATGIILSTIRAKQSYI
jgi:23S rRNA (guanosine2251-2'-O)-methyltransferase